MAIRPACARTLRTAAGGRCAGTPPNRQQSPVWVGLGRPGFQKGSNPLPPPELHHQLVPKQQRLWRPAVQAQTVTGGGHKMESLSAHIAIPRDTCLHDRKLYNLRAGSSRTRSTAGSKSSSPAQGSSSRKLRSGSTAAGSSHTCARASSSSISIAPSIGRVSRYI